MEDQYKISHQGEVHINMNGGSHAFIAESAKINHRQITGPRGSKESDRTERRSEASPQPDVTKNFSRMPKIHWVPQPNNFGEIRGESFKRKAGKGGVHKGGAKY
jgi:hypothetical protein